MIDAAVMDSYKGELLDSGKAILTQEFKGKKVLGVGLGEWKLIA